MARVPPILRRAREFRAQLIAGEAQATGQMASAYRSVAGRLRPSLDVVIAQLVADSASGKLASPLLAARRAEVQRVLDLAERELSVFSRTVSAQTAARQSVLVALAGNHAEELARLSSRLPLMQWSQPSAAHLEKLIGLMRPGTPAHDLIEQLAPTGVERVKAALISGLAAGRTPEKIGQDVQDVLGGNLGRFLTVARTEDMRAYRISTQENFQANADVVGQWRWMASLSYDTCAACLSLHGELFPLSQEMDSHPNCRCVPLPVVAGAPLEKWESGEQWLRSQPEEIQRKALGPSKFEAWKGGEISLADLRGHSHNEVWGGAYHETSLKNALEKAKMKSTQREKASSAINIKSSAAKITELQSNRDEVRNLVLGDDYKPKSLTPEKLKHLSSLVSVAGFSSEEPQRVPGRLVQMKNLAGEIIQTGDYLPTSEVHYLDHVVGKREFPSGTSYEDYLEYAKEIINDPDSGIYVSQRGSRWHLAFIRESREMKAPGGHIFVMVEYRVATGHWMTFFQPERGLDYLAKAHNRGNGQWLRKPKLRDR